MAVIIIIAAFVLSSHNHSAVVPSETATTTATTQTGLGNASVGATGASQVITYTDSGFSPSSITVTEGATVTWVNQSSGKMWVASGNHPSHTLYDGTSASDHCANNAPDSATVFDECTATLNGGSFSFTFGKSGSWTYHNHVHASDQGTVVVTGS